MTPFALRSPAIPAAALLTLLAAVGPQPARADGIVDLKVDSKPRRYDVKNPVQTAEQTFGLTKAGMLTLVHVIDPVHKDARGGMSLDEVNLRNFQVGRGIFQERIPDDAIPGQKREFKQQWLCPPRKEPLNLRASLTAPYRPDPGVQLGASQRLTIDFVPFDKISEQPGPKAAIDVAGKWFHGELPALWTLTPKADGGYDAVEKGYDNAKGTARVKGRKVYIDWATTTAKGDAQHRGVTVVEVKADNTHAEGWSVGTFGTGGAQWSAAPGTVAKPLAPPKP